MRYPRLSTQELAKLSGANEDEKFAQLVQKWEPRSRLLRTWVLHGGISAQVTALEVARPDGRTRKMVVRRHGTVDRQHNPQIAADEFRLLQLLHTVGLPAPQPYYLDQSGEIFPAPYIVLEYIEGQPEFAPTDLAQFLGQSATQLSRIHRVASTGQDLSFLPQQEIRSAAALSAGPPAEEEATEERRLWETLTAVWPLAPRNGAVLLHGDFWPGNMLWQAGRLAAVIDWEDAQVGDPLGDLANSRLEMLWAFGSEAMQRFTQAYQALAPVDYTHLPYWDLYAAWRDAAKFAAWAADAHSAQIMRERHHWFITQAFQALAAQGAL